MGGRAHELQGPRDIGSQLFPVDHRIEHPVLEEKLAALEAWRELLANRLLDDPRSGKSNQRARFTDIQVPQHGKRGGDASGGGVG